MSSRLVNQTLPCLESLEGRLLLASWFVAADTDPLENGSFSHPFDSIQQAIDAAAAGDSVIVGPGTYTGDLQITKANLLLATYPDSTASLQFVDGAGLSILAGGVAVRGNFSYRPGAATTVLVSVADATNRVEISGGQFELSAAGLVGIDLGSGTAKAKVSGNTFAATANATALDGADVLDATISLNRFTATTAAAAAVAIDFAGAQAGSDITGNYIDGYGTGVAIYDGSGVFAVLRGNYFIECQTGLFFGQVPGGEGGAIYSAGVYGNYFFGNGTGIVVDDGANIDASGIHVYQGNGFWSNDVAINNRNALTLPAGPRLGDTILPVGVANWFGDASGPAMASNPRGRGGKVLGNVDFYNRNWLAAAPPIVPPGVTATLGTGAWSNPSIPGDTITVPVVFTNTNAFTVAGLITLDLSVTPQAGGQGSDLPDASFMLSLAANQSITRQFTVVLDGRFDPGTHCIGGLADSGTIMQQTLNQPTVTVDWVFGSFGGRKNAVLTVGSARYALKGGGYGRLVATGDEGVTDLDLFATTKKSAVSITPIAGNPGWSLRDVNSADPVASLIAPQTAVLGDMSFAAGIGNLTVASIANNQQHLLDIGPSNTVRSVSLSLGPVTDLQLTSALPISTLTVGEWIETAGLGRVNWVDAPAVGTLYSAGVFSADLGAPDSKVALKNASVKGGLYSAEWYLTGTVSSLALGSADGSLVFVDVAEGVVGLPAAEADFTAAGRIAKLTIPTMSNTFIAASTIGTVTIGRSKAAIPGENLGLAAELLKSLIYTGRHGRVRLNNLNWPGQMYQDEGFELRIV